MTEQREDQDREPAETSDRQWMTRGVGGIGAASFLADVGHEVPTALMTSLVTGTLGAPASALGLIEGISDGLAGAGRFVGGPLADDVGRRSDCCAAAPGPPAVCASRLATPPARRRRSRLGLRTCLRVRAHDGQPRRDRRPALALGLVAVFSVRTAILISVIPGLLAALAIVYAIRHARLPAAWERRPLRIRVRPVLHGQLGRLLGAFALFEIGNLAATLLILRATDLLAPAPGRNRTRIRTGRTLLRR